MSIDVKKTPNFLVDPQYKGNNMGPHVGQGRFSLGATRAFTIPGEYCFVAETWNIFKDVLVLEPFVMKSEATLDAMLYEITVAGTAGSTAKMVIYAADENWVLGVPILTPVGTLPMDSIGVKILSGLNTVLPPGRYFKGLKHNSVANPTLYFLRASDLNHPLSLTSLNVCFSDLISSQPYANAFPNPGPVPTAGTHAETDNHYILLDFSVV